MIKNISSDQYLTVVGQGYPYLTQNGSLCGALRYNTQSSSIEVYDGCTWHNMSGHATVSLSQSTADVIEWGKRKMQEERQLIELANKYPAVAAALEHRDKSQAVLDGVVALVKDY